MEKVFEIMTATRGALVRSLESLSTAQHNVVPAGFNNNIIWNLAHMVAAQQGVCYKRGNLPMKIADDFFEGYKPDTRPVANVDDVFIAMVKQQLLITVDQLREDYTAGLFKQNPAWVNRFGINHQCIEDTLQFILLHDGLHMGYIAALKKLV